MTDLSTAVESRVSRAWLLPIAVLRAAALLLGGCGGDEQEDVADLENESAGTLDTSIGGDVPGDPDDLVTEEGVDGGRLHDDVLAGDVFDQGPRADGHRHLRAELWPTRRRRRVVERRGLDHARAWVGEREVLAVGERRHRLDAAAELRRRRGRRA